MSEWLARVCEDIRKTEPSQHAVAMMIEAVYELAYTVNLRYGNEDTSQALDAIWQAHTVLFSLPAPSTAEEIAEFTREMQDDDLPRQES